MSNFISVYDKITNTGEIVNTILEVSAMTKIPIQTLKRYLSANKTYNGTNYIIFRRKVDKNYNKVKTGRKGGNKRIENKNKGNYTDI